MVKRRGETQQEKREREGRERAEEKAAAKIEETRAIAQKAIDESQKRKA